MTRLPDEEVVREPAVEGTPAFEGAWAESFQTFYSNSSSDYERKVLEDGTVSDQELAETRDRFRECLSAFGFTKIEFGDDGSFTLQDPPGIDQATGEAHITECSEETGERSIGALHSWVRRNPENLDENKIMAACLVRKDVVDASYSAEDYARDVPTESFPYSDSVRGRTAFVECNVDPLGRFE